MISRLEELGYIEKTDTLLTFTAVIKGTPEEQALVTSQMTELLFRTFANRTNMKTDLDVHRPRKE